MFLIQLKIYFIIYFDKKHFRPLPAFEFKKIFYWKNIFLHYSKVKR